MIERRDGVFRSGFIGKAFADAFPVFVFSKV